MRIFLLVITGFEESFRKIDDIRRRQCEKYNIPVLFLYNGIPPEGMVLRDDERLLPVQNHVPGQYIKFHLGMKEIFSRYKVDDFDYVVRCTSAGFIDFNKLPMLLSYLPKKRCHAGRFVWNDYGVYMSGPCMLFSSDVAYKFAQKDTYHPRVFEHSDDVMISREVRDYADFCDLNFFWTNLEGKTEMPTRDTILPLHPSNVIFRVKNYMLHKGMPEFTKEKGLAIDLRYWELLSELTDC
jgi:hypothetical protein